jgi:hypothetical protein
MEQALQDRNRGLSGWVVATTALRALIVSTWMSSAARSLP